MYALWVFVWLLDEGLAWPRPRPRPWPLPRPREEGEEGEVEDDGPLRGWRLGWFLWPVCMVTFLSFFLSLFFFGIWVPLLLFLGSLIIRDPPATLLIFFSFLFSPAYRPEMLRNEVEEKKKTRRSSFPLSPFYRITQFPDFFFSTALQFSSFVYMTKKEKKRKNSSITSSFS